MPEIKPSKSKTYRYIAYGLGGLGVLLLGLIFVLYRSKFSGRLSEIGQDWGLFGSYIGGVGGTILGLLTLVALVTALVVQSHELEYTRQALEAQVNETKENERRRVRPYLKYVWTDLGGGSIAWSIKNVGGGPALLERVDLYVDGEKVASHKFLYPVRVQAAWIAALTPFYEIWEIARIEGDYRKLVTPAPLSETSRLLAPNETFDVVAVQLRSSGLVPQNIAALNLKIYAVIHFQSILGESISTRTQIDGFQNVGLDPEPEPEQTKNTE